MKSAWPWLLRALSMSTAVALLLLLFLATAPTGVTAARTFRVPSQRASIQQAIDSAVDGNTILVAPGTYYENINFHGKAVTVTSEEGPEVTIIDGSQAGSVVTFASGEQKFSVLSGFTLRNGRAGAASQYRGGGVVVLESYPTITGNVITNNTGCSGGGGIGILLGGPIIKENVITDNTQGACSGGTGGGGIGVLVGPSTQILDNVISNNSWPTASGGGISLNDAGTPRIRGNLISGNTAGFDGGGISIVNRTDAFIDQNLITGNSAFKGGGVYWLVPSGRRGSTLVNNTIADNHGFGSGIFADGFDAETRLINNLVIGSEGETAVLCGTGYDPASTPMFEFNNVFSPLGAAYGGSCSDQTGISGNISADPLFVDPSNGDYHLQPGSPAIDAGDNTAPRLLQEQDLHLLRPDTDFDGDYRILDGDGDGVAVVDIGIDEFSPAPTPALTCGGLGATIVGTEGDDVITGTNGPDVIVGLGGNDVIDGRGGDDVICGGDGDDVLEGGPRNDVLDGGKGEDTLKGGPGTDDCDGSGGDDTAENCETVSNVP